MQVSNSVRMRLWYDSPARQWLEALPIGNGRLGAMVYGAPDSETLQLNESSIWSGGPHNYDSPDALGALPEIRRLVLAGDWKAAQALTDEKFMGRPVVQAMYQTAGSLSIAVDGSNDPSEYGRELDIDDAVARVSYESGGVRFGREAFASYPAQVIVQRFTADTPGALSLALRFDSPQQFTATVNAGSITVGGVAGPSSARPGQIRFAVIVRVIANEGGLVGAERDALSVRAASEATVVIGIATSYRDYNDLSGDPHADALARVDAAAARPFEDLLREHLDDYHALYRRFSISLGRTDASIDRPTDVRIEEYSAAPDPALASLYCQYGRYLLIASSRPGGLPANLQGIWNDSMRPAWGSKWTINMNTQMNYWPAAPCNLIDCFEPLLRLLERMRTTGARTAAATYGARGWVAHHNVDIWLGTAPVDGAFWGMWPCGGAWLLTTLFQHYHFTGDRTFLARSFPVLRGAVEFFLDTLVDDPDHGYLVTCPSLSPENAHHPDCSLCAGPTIDQQILRDLFDDFVLSAGVLGVDSELCDQVAHARSRLAPMQIANEGRLQEWLEDWDSIAPEQNHRHIAHLYGLHPSNQISPERTPDLCEAARKTLVARGDESTGWAMAWRMNFWARLGDGEHAHELLRGLISPGRTAPNMFDLHPPFQIDGNFGATAGIVEMLVQSHLCEIHLLPALPDAWDSGTVRGALARGGFEVDFSWSSGLLTHASVRSHLGGPCRLRSAAKSVEFETIAGRSYAFGSDFSRATTVHAD